jgi:hypothetical protein
MAQILKRSSFGLVRTNPKLTTNIKIVADSKNQVYLESIDADPLLSKSIYKGYNVTGGSFSQDIKRFYSQGSDILPKSIAYKVYEKDSSKEVKSRYKDQYDFTYCMGMESKNSRLYSEEFSLFFPLWVEAENIPDYFVIFKLDGPVSVDYLNSSYDIDSDPNLEPLVSGATSFYENYMKGAKIIKTFDLTETSAIGQYIRNHAKDLLFPEASMYVSLDKNEISYWNGISYDEGGFCRKGQNIYKEFVLVDKTVTENDDFITLGFQRNGVIHPNILNLEFLFDDTDQEKYKFSRYYGLYVSEAELGKFEIDGSRLFADKDAEPQSPTPKKDIIGYSNNIIDQFQSNPNGIKIYPKIGPSGGTSIFDGRLITWNETQNPRIPYVKDAEGNFYSINSTNNWTSSYLGTGSTSYEVSSFLRIKNNIINWKTFTGFDAPFAYIKSLTTDSRGRPHFSFDVINKPANGDQIRIFYTDWNIPDHAEVMDYYTVIASDDITIRPGDNRGLIYSSEGSDSQVASAIAKAINYIETSSGEPQIFKATSLGTKVLVYCKIDSENWNKIRYTMFSRLEQFPWSKPYQFQEIDPNKAYLTTPVQSGDIIYGNYFEYHFVGGCDKPKNRFIINKEDYEDFYDPKDPIYIKTDLDFDLAGEYSFYLDEPIYDNFGNIIEFRNINKYYVYQLEDKNKNVSFTSSKSVSLYRTRKNTNGYLSIFPIRDFDFDFLDVTYSKNSDSDYKKLYDFYKGSTAYGPTATFTYFDLGATSKTAIDSIYGSNSSFNLAGGFKRLNGQIDDILDSNEEVVNEYDRLKENTIPEIALSSRVVPFINKWVYDNECVDVRENPYRLNTDQSFGYSNFSPSFEEYNPNSKFFTHEWYYLQKYPPYLTTKEKYESFSYFDEDLNFPEIPLLDNAGSTGVYQTLIGSTGNLLSSNEDYFLSYFTRETIGGSAIPRDFKYTTFSSGTDEIFPETFFRGSKVIIKDRSEFSEINYNIESLRFFSNPKYNTYKFSAVLTYGPNPCQITCIKNDIWKSVTMVIQSDLNDDLFMKYRTGSTFSKFIDRSSFYTLKSKYVLQNDDLSYSNVSLSGEIYKWEWIDSTSRFKVYLRRSASGSIPNLLSEVSINELGSYNPITVSLNPFSISFVGIEYIESNSFICSDIECFGGIPDVDRNENSIMEISPDRTWMTSIPSGWTSFLNYVPVFIETLLRTPSYQQGGYGHYDRLFSTISFASIADQINSGNPEIRYININEDEDIEFNTFCLEIPKPDYLTKSTYLKSIPLRAKPSIFQNVKGTIGYEMTSLDRTIINQIARYRGNYNPKWRDLIKFIDTNDIKQNALEYNNIQIFDKTDYLVNENLFNLKNIYYNKVNVESPNIILRSAGEDVKTVYPLVGEIAIGNRDLFTFKSSWDTAYFVKNQKSNIFQYIIGTREPKEDKSYFGSKIIAMPAAIRLETFPQGIIQDTELGPPSRIKAVKQNLVKTITKRNQDNFLNIKVYTTLALEDYLIDDGFAEEFYKYINPNYSFGNVNLDDDIKYYVKENITKRYIISEIILWEKFWPASAPLANVIYDLTDEEKIANGYVKTRNFQTNFNDNNDMDFQLIYTIPKDKNYSIAFTVVLEKK